MSVWGAGSFDNDDAYDWVYEVEETKDLFFILETLKAITRSQGYLELPDCCRAVAAAEVIAAIKGKGSPDAPAEIRAWLKKHPQKVNQQHIRLALQAILMIKLGSELSQWWENAPDADTWFECMNNLEARLSAP